MSEISIFDLKSLGMAYRKAKVDLFYSSHYSLEAVADYEEKLFENLNDLKRRLLDKDESWIEESKFLGDWTLITKSVDISIKREHNNVENSFVFSTPSEEWDFICSQKDKEGNLFKPKAEFRLMSNCSLDFHVLSTLWMIEVGQKFDAKLTDSAYGNRLRRTKDGLTLNPNSLGTFKPYLQPFREWRDNGINSMRDALENGKKIVAVTADITSYYHELNADFMLDPEFIDKIMQIDLDEAQTKLHRLFINAVRAWSSRTPLKKGIPVGLPASSIIANIALIELDRLIENQVVPIYYGRYVDDILLVMENGALFNSTTELWNWLIERSGGILGRASDNENNAINFHPNYHKGSKIFFANSKNKVYMLSGGPGKTLVNAIAQQIYERASEWRAMPRLPQSINQVSTDLFSATQSDGEAADNLRKTDALTMRRAGFAIKLRDFEAYERDLPPETWKTLRHAFFQAFIQHVMVLPYFFDLAVYLPRVVRLATACEDFLFLRKIINALDKISIQLEQNCQLSIKSCPEDHFLDHTEIMRRWKIQIYGSVVSSIRSAFPTNLTYDGNASWHENMPSYFPVLHLFNGIKEFQEWHSRLYSFDLAHMPFRFLNFPKEMVSQRGIPSLQSIHNCEQSEYLANESITKGLYILCSWLKFEKLPNGLLFATRPFSLPELFLLNSNLYEDQGLDSLQKIISAVRGFKIDKSTPYFDNNGVFRVPTTDTIGKCKIAISSWKTNLDSWNASIMCMPDPDLDRYSRLCRIVNGVISNKPYPRYFVMPELSMPAHWFIRIARKLHGRGISLISGVEYLHSKKMRVHNQAWVALAYGEIGFSSMVIYRQDKQHPALHEESELKRLAGLELKPEKKWIKGLPPIIQHGSFRFALLICSELTNINYRSALRGKIDALFVPEWNQDTETFNALVESAALDIHAYIIQCNDRQYGDSRIRAPYKDSWMRDLLRVKGGVTDYCVIGEIDVLALRQFQSCYRSPSTPFKPVPDGFEIDLERKVLPVGEKQ